MHHPHDFDMRRHGGRGRRGPFPPGFGFEREFGRGPRRGRGHRRGRGDVQAAVLALLAERPMHGYEIIQEINERSGGYWRPSPGSVYPTLQMLTDRGLLSQEGGTGNQRQYMLTDEGRVQAEQQQTPPWQQVTDEVGEQEIELHTALHQLVSAVAQVSQAATDTQKARAIDTLNETRRAIYAILGSSE
ncbi:PadR family transcriptional regulator [Kibdelosporangium aridum]|uniref:DNA-binding transcriptional regulator, PadR family n=1 Tax=Kibdelosporangium aridum TaxID=2030 RepID=A0A1W2FHQ0_KIBAR|nr:PadR family transcriptional regulator [Kibdelosporangium aridum]SMD21192.1 DNA-binding transcriptional regulator, PadR family [Kibdelosporangium aridum]